MTWRSATSPSRSRSTTRRRSTRASLPPPGSSTLDSARRSVLAAPCTRRGRRHEWHPGQRHGGRPQRHGDPARRRRGFTTVFPTGNALPTTSTVNVERSGQTRWSIRDGAARPNGSVSVLQPASQIIVDVVGFYGPAVSAAGRLVPLAPSRILNTRNGTGVAAGGMAELTANQTIELQVTGARPWRAGHRPRQPDERVGRDRQRDRQPDHGAPHSSLPSRVQRASHDIDAERVAQPMKKATIGLEPGHRRVGRRGRSGAFSQAGGHLIVDVVGYVTGNANALATPPPACSCRSRRAASSTRASAQQSGRRQRLDRRAGARCRWRAGRRRARPRRHRHCHAERRQRVHHGATPPAPCDPRRRLSKQSIRANQTIANGIVLGTGTGGRITLYTPSGSHLIADVVRLLPVLTPPPFRGRRAVCRTARRSAAGRRDASGFRLALVEEILADSNRRLDGDLVLVDRAVLVDVGAGHGGQLDDVGHAVTIDVVRRRGRPRTTSATPSPSTSATTVVTSVTMSTTPSPSSRRAPSR